MGRRDRRGVNPLTPKVESIQVPDKNVKWRVVGLVLSLIVAVAALTYGVSALTAVDKGWQNIQATGDVEYTSEFVLNYNIGASDMSAKAESREVKALYSQALTDAGQALSTVNAAPGNLRSLNEAPNEELELDPILYAALELLTQAGDRTMYLGPAFGLYNGLFSCDADWQLPDFDPELNAELRELYGRIAAYANDPESVRIELLGDNRAVLRVSQEYLRFLEEEGLGPIMDLYWMKNAFIVDHVADGLAAGGFTRGAVSSADGYCRNLTGEQYSLNVFSGGDGVSPIVACRLDYTGPAALVSFRAFPLSEDERWYYYTDEEGVSRSRYLSLTDALPASTAGSLTAISGSLSCAETMLRAAPVFLDGAPKTEELSALSSQGIEAVCPAGGTVWATSPELDLQNVYTGWTVKTTD